ncbi:MAG: ATP-dependent zinc metalloprotease FtsH [Actinomycetota bacterium]|nr:ATP-dependent zinc metalloprotease FtsH [Actinomycetota bacterium]
MPDTSAPPPPSDDAVVPRSGVDHLLRRGRREVKQFLVRRRRARAAKKGTPKRKRSTIILVGTLILLFGVFAAALEYLQPKPTGEELSVDAFVALAEEKRLTSATFLDEDAVVQGAFVEPPPEPEPRARDDRNSRNADDRPRGQTGGGGNARAGGADNPPAGGADNPRAGDGAATEGGGPNNQDDNRTNERPEVAEPPSAAPEGAGDYWVSYPTSDAFTAVLVETAATAGATVTIDPQQTKQAVRLIATFLLPLMILANMFALLFTAGRGGGAGIGEVQMFGTIAKGKVAKGQAKAVSFADVGGAEEAVAELREVRDYLTDPEKYEEIGALPPKGVLLVGPPGCGKTLMAKAVAGEAGVPFFSVAGAEFVESLVGVGAARVRDLFARVRAVAPAIVFIDELDAAARKRGMGGGGGGSEEREQTLNQLLVEMDGFDVSQGVVVMGATNRPDILDPAILRPGRFDRFVTVETPDFDGRIEILQLHARGKPMAPDVDYAYLAKRTPGFSGADLANVINEAALLTIRMGKSEVDVPLLEEAIQRVVSGTQKKGRVLSPEERQRAAYHESGHAIVTAATGHVEDLHRVSILARGRSIGAASVRRETDAVLFTKSELFVQLVTAMGGLAAEELVFGEHSTGAEQDLVRATDLARDMVGRYGMGSKRRRLLAKNIDEFLAGDADLAEISTVTHQEMEDEIDRLLKEAEHEAARLIGGHRDLLDRMAARLVSEETLEGAELARILSEVVPTAAVSGNGAAPGVGTAGSGALPANKKRRE